jgi:Transcription termination factor nusG
MKSSNIPAWYIVYTKPSQEKKVADYFSQKNIEHYCPMKKIKPQYSGLLKTTCEPLFPSYVFVHIAPVGHARISMIPQVINLVYWLGEPAFVRNQEIDAIKKFLCFYNDVQLEKIPVSANGAIAVMYSPIPNGQNTMQGTMSGFVKMRLPSLGYTLKASVGRELIKWADILQLTNYPQSIPVAKFAS